MIEVLLLAFALSMDAFAVSLALGARASHTKSAALKVALYFGLFQGIMPLIGFLIGQQSAKYLAAFDHWIAFALLFFIGAKMIYESCKKDEDKKPLNLSHKTLFLLSIATSLDALAAGFTLMFLPLSPYVSICIIAFVTFLISFCGVKTGAKSGKWLGSSAEILGGVILVIIGVKILMEHL
jgi:putative Mn2+ efflux pump MntP